MKFSTTIKTLIFLVAFLKGFAEGGIMSQDHEVSQERFEQLDAQFRQGSLSPQDSIDILKQFTLYYQNLLPDSLHLYADMLFETGMRYNNAEGISYGLLMQGFYHYLKGSYSKALDFYKKVEQFSTEASYREGEHLALQYMGLIYLEQGDFVNASAMMQQSHLLAKSLVQPDKLAYSYLNMGLLYMNQGFIAEARDYNLTALELFKALGYQMGQGYAYLNLAHMERTHHTGDSALWYYQQGYEVVKKALPTARVLAYALNGLAGMQIEEGMYDAAQKSIDEGWQIAQATQNKWGQNILLITLAELNLEKGSFLEAISNSEKVYKIGVDIGAKEVKMEAAEILMEAYAGLGQYQQAYEWQRAFISLKDSVFNRDKARQIGRLESQLDIKRREAENEQLRQEARILDETIKRQKFILWGGAFLLTAVLLIAYLLWANNQQKKESNLQLRELNKQIEQQKTEIKAQNEQLSSTNQRLQELDKERELFTQMVVHDMKAPLNRVKGMMSVMRLENKGNPAYERYAHDVSQIVDEGLEFIQSLLDVNKVEFSSSADFQATSPSLVAKDVVAGYGQLAQDKRIQLQLSLSPDPEQFNTDPKMLARLLENLISNAIKFSPSGTKVFVSTQRQGNSFVFSVMDQGPGISVEDRDRMFQKFAKLSARPTGGESSHGLGLYIVKKLAERLGGNVELNSALGKGSEFRVVFPLETVKNLKGKNEKAAGI